MAQWGNRDQLSDAPKFIADGDTGESGQDIYGTTPIGVFGVDTAETAAARGDGKGSVPPGWVLREEGPGLRAGRVHHEVLVAMSKNGMTTDAADFANTSTETVADANTALNIADDTEFPDS